MGNTTEHLAGPDLKNGIPVKDFANKNKLLGHADGQAVLLIYDGQTFYAVGAKCSHYGANLNDGLILNHEIRCPWHHACFDIKNGDAIKSPALNPLPTWNVEIKNDIVYVRDRKDQMPCPHDTTNDKHFVIIGSGAAGAAGHAAAEQLRKERFDGKITLISADADLPYDRPNLSKDYLAGNAPEEWMPLRSSDYFREQKIDLLLKTTVRKIDPSNNTVVLNNNTSITFQKCLIAMGCTPGSKENKA